MKKILLTLLLLPLSIWANQKDLDKKLFQACTSGDLKQVQQLLEEGADIDAADGRNNTALSRAAEHGHTKIAKLLIKRGADIHQVGIWGYTALQKAASKGRIEIVKMLLQAGANPVSPDSTGKTPFQWAARNNRVDIIKMFLKENSTTIPQQQKELALSEAAAKGHNSLVTFLLKQGVQPTYTNLAQAASIKKGNGAIVKTLLNKGLAPNKVDPKSGQNCSPALHNAVSAGNIDTVKLLLKAGASKANYGSNNLLEEALPKPFKVSSTQELEKKTALVKSLFNQSLNKDIIKTSNVKLLLSAILENNLELVQLLIAAGAPLNKIDNKYDLHFIPDPKSGGTTINVAPLHVAAYYGFTPIVELLIEAGADPFILTKQDFQYSNNPLSHKNALELALIKGHTQTIASLQAALLHYNNPCKAMLDKALDKKYIYLIERLVTHQLPLSPSEILEFGKKAQQKYQETNDSTYKTIGQILKKAYYKSLSQKILTNAGPQKEVSGQKRLTSENTSDSTIALPADIATQIYNYYFFNTVRHTN